VIIWLSGNSGAGKTTIADAFRKKHPEWILLDGDDMRNSISLGAGFSKKDREEHNLRVARLAKILNGQGHNIIIAVIAPFQSTRDKINKIIECKWVYIKKDLPFRSGYPYEILVTAKTLYVDEMMIDEEVYCLEVWSEEP